jgi:hypothetical protein
VKKLIILSALALLSSGCIKTVPQAIDDNEGKIVKPEAKCEQKKSDGVVYRNENLGFEFQPSEFILAETQQPDSSGYDFIFKSANSEGSVMTRISGENFSDLGKRLSEDQKNGVIKDLQETEVNCQKAYSFEDISKPGEKIIETVSGQRLYLVSGGLTKQEILSSFRFFEVE